MVTPSFLRGLAGALFPVAVAGSGAAVVARLAGQPVGWILLVPAVSLLLAGMVAAAAPAAAAVARRDWWWAVALLVLWPVGIPLYLRARRTRASGQAEV
jgi:hypothetical protein